MVLMSVTSIYAGGSCSLIVLLCRAQPVLLVPSATQYLQIKCEEVVLKLACALE
jgi:hypothetical protein